MELGIGSHVSLGALSRRRLAPLSREWLANELNVQYFDIEDLAEAPSAQESGPLTLVNHAHGVPGASRTGHFPDTRRRKHARCYEKCDWPRASVIPVAMIAQNRTPFCYLSLASGPDGSLLTHFGCRARFLTLSLVRQFFFVAPSCPASGPRSRSLAAQRRCQLARRDSS